MTAPDTEKAAPNSFVALIPVVWDLDGARLLTEVHGDTWMEEVEFVVEATDEGDGVFGRGAARFANGTEASIVVEEPIEQLADIAGLSRDPFLPAEVALLKAHRAIWRVTLTGERDRCRDTARRFARLLGTFVEAGAVGAFLPFALEMHSGRFIKQQTRDLSEIPSLVNLFVNAWNTDTWMVTRGLTVFGLPELETRIDEGLNAAYFRLMDVASGMIIEQDGYPVGSRLQVGPKVYQVDQGPNGPRDEQVPISGAFGVLTVAPPTSL